MPDLPLRRLPSGQQLSTPRRGASGSNLLLVALAGALFACSKVRDIKRDSGDEVSAAGDSDAGHDGGADDIKRRIQAETEAKLRECGVISREGKHAATTHPADHYICPNSCFLRASCEEAKLDWCRTRMPLLQPMQRAPELWECQRKCFEPTIFCDATLRNVARCDDKKECPDGSDEADCDYFVCENGERIHFMGRCDGESQCRDGSDEDDCFPLFECDDGEVHGSETECDGVAHCQDESDERGCIERGLVVECAGGGWIPTSAICNGWPDCGDGSDETQGCAQNLCATP